MVAPATRQCMYVSFLLLPSTSPPCSSSSFTSPLLLSLSQVLDYDIDGWKCDGTDPYVLEIIGSHGKGGYVSRKDYSDAYYSDFFDYTRQKLGKSRLIMSRPVDA